jgi:RecA-family ATPase
MSDPKPSTGPVLRSMSPTPIGDLPKRIADAYTVHISRIFDQDIAEVPFLVEGCVPRSCITLITGESSAGKSFVAYDLARAISSGTSWLNRAKALGQKEVVLVANYDNPTKILKTRIIKMGFERDSMCFVHTQGMTTPMVRGGSEMLRLPEEQSKLKYVIQELRPALIVFDSLRQGQTLDENSNQEMAQLWAIFKGWTEMESKPAVVVLHHTSKNTQNSNWSTSARGSGEIISSSDVVIEVRVDPKDGVHTLNWTKTRPWPIGQTSSTKFEIVDKYDDNSEETAEEDDDNEDVELGRVHTYVNAIGVLPGEAERAIVERIVKFISDRPVSVKVTTLVEIQKETNLAKALVREAVQRARSQGLIKFKHTKNANGYVLTNKL